MENFDWKNLPFGYYKTDYNVRCYYRDGKWGPLEVTDSEYISIHMAATALHYGQEAFEGLKAYRGRMGGSGFSDGKKMPEGLSIQQGEYIWLKFLLSFSKKPFLKQ